MCMDTGADVPLAGPEVREHANWTDTHEVTVA